MNIPPVAIVVVVIVVAFVFVAFLGSRASTKKLGELRSRGLYPQEGKETDADILRLLKNGEKILAIRCYRELHKVGLKEAKEAVEEIEQKKG